MPLAMPPMIQKAPSSPSNSSAGILPTRILVHLNLSKSEQIFFPVINAN